MTALKYDPRMALILGIESTCDETAAALVRDGTSVLSSVVASQAELHATYRGVVPEIASRAHIENILPVIQRAVAEAGVGLGAIEAISVAHRPGLIGSLLIGVTAGKTLAWALGKPLLAVDHVQSHLYSVRLDEAAQPPFPAVGLAISGGHTALYAMQSFHELALLGSTIDDAVGEAYDKVSFILGLGYPGGPVIDQLAAQGDPVAVRFPRSSLGRDSLDFSLSGLKTSVLYHVRGRKGRERLPSELSPQQIADVAASFQAACLDVLLTKLKRAIRSVGAKSVIIGGGVSANRGLRAAAARLPVPVFFPPLHYCTDNAAMSAGLAHEKFCRGETATWDLDAITSSSLR
jgi:N6-L-threonylcarbamoyladenine synthase